MTSLSSPISIQLGPASITCPRQPPHLLPIHSGISSRFRVLCIQGTGNASKPKPPMPTENDEFSGWSNDNVNGGESAEMQGKKWRGGKEVYIFVLCSIM